MRKSRKHDQVPENEREQVDEELAASDSVDEDLTPLQEADLRRRLALEVQSFEGGIEG